MNTELIQLKDVTKKFGKNIVLENINLDIPEKQITGIIGASGRGKTTILKMIIGYVCCSRETTRGICSDEGDVECLKEPEYFISYASDGC